MARVKRKKGTTRAVKPSAKKAAKAITQLRKTIGLPTAPLAREISEKIRELARDKDVLVEWEVRVIRGSDTIEAVCNCKCYA
jgi:hypothetical protein